MKFLIPSCVLLSSVLCYSIPKSEDLIFVVAIYRHGDRTPIDTFPTDPYQGEEYWPDGAAQLTNIGKQQQYELGQWLRQRYGNFLPKKYVHKDIYVRSTDVDRALMSAASNLAGLYQPDEDNNWSSTIHWQPIPIHTESDQNDEVLRQKRPCQKYDELYSNLEKSEFFTKFNNEHKKDFEYIAKHAGMNVTSVNHAVDVQDAMYLFELRNLTLPEWAHAVYPEPLLTFAELWLHKFCFTQEMARLRTGPLLKEIFQNFDKKINNTLTQKLWMYSGHDDTIVNILKGLNISEPDHIPPYCSVLLFELYSSQNSSFVEMHYRNATKNAEPHILTIPGCSERCPLSEIKKLASPIIPNDWVEECQK